MVQSIDGRVTIIGGESKVLGEFATIVVGMFDTCDEDNVLKTLQKVLEDIKDGKIDEIRTKKGVNKTVEKEELEETVDRLLKDENVPNFVKEVIKKESKRLKKNKGKKIIDIED